MNKLKRITQYLLDHGAVKRNKLDAWIEQGEFKPSAKNLGNGYTILSMEYHAVISIEQYAGSAELLAAMVAIWMQENAGRFDNPDVGFEADKTDDELFDIELQFMLVEDVQIVQADDGPLTFNGQNYRIDSVEHWVAEDFDLDAQIKR